MSFRASFCPVGQFRAFPQSDQTPDLIADQEAMEEGLETTALQLTREPALSQASTDFLAGSPCFGGPVNAFSRRLHVPSLPPLHRGSRLSCEYGVRTGAKPSCKHLIVLSADRPICMYELDVLSTYAPCPTSLGLCTRLRTCPQVALPGHAA